MAGMEDQLIVPVILCGGAGTRLWPVSREKMPKQFVPLIGTSSTFQQVLDRVTCAGLFAPPIIITNSEFRFVVAEQARSRGVKATIVLEPQRRAATSSRSRAASASTTASAANFSTPDPASAALSYGEFNIHSDVRRQWRVCVGVCQMTVTTPTSSSPSGNCGMQLAWIIQPMQADVA
jgi:Nucleotidyl transferase